MKLCKLLLCFVVVLLVLQRQELFAQQQDSLPQVGEGSEAGLITLPSPFNDYYLIVTDLGPEALSDGDVIGSFALALAAQGHFYNAWQFSEQVEPALARAEVRLGLANFLITAGNRTLAKDALDSASHLLTNVIPDQQGLDHLESGMYRRYAHTLERLVVNFIDYRGRDETLKLIASTKDSTVFALMITYYINQIGENLITGDTGRSDLTATLLEIVYSTLQTLKDRQAYLDNLISLTNSLIKYQNNDRSSTLDPNTLIDEIIDIMGNQPTFVREDRQVALVKLLAASDRLDDATQIIISIEEPRLRASMMIYVAQELAQQKKHEQALQLFDAATQLVQATLPTSQVEAFYRWSIPILTREKFWAKAYELVIYDDEDFSRAQRAAAMGKTLLELGLEEELDKLWVWVTDSNLRAELYLGAAEMAFKQNQREKGFTFISNIFLESSFSSRSDGFDPEIITRALTYSLSYGDIEQINRDFDRAFQALSFTQDQGKKLYIETLILQLFARRSEVKSQQAFERAQDILLDMWQFRDNPYYPVTTVALIRLLAIGGRTTLAITQASAMWENPTQPVSIIAKQQALAYALEESLKQNKVDVAKQSLIAINNPVVARRALITMLRSVAGLPVTPILAPDSFAPEAT